MRICHSGWEITELMKPKKVARRTRLSIKPFVVGVIASLIILIAGCEVTSNPTLITMSTERGSLPTRTITMITPTKTVLSSSIVSIPTTMETRTPSMPTLSATEGLNFLFEVLKTNGGCDFPCFMGIIPGKTTFEEAKEVFMQTGWSISIIPQTDGDAMTANSPKNSSIGIDAWIRTVDNIVSHLEISIGGAGYLNYVDYHALINILSRFGKPDGIWISLPPALKELRLEQTTFKMVVYYKDKNMIFQYDGIANLKGDTYEICPPRPWGKIEGIPPNSGSVLIDIFAEDVQLHPKELLNFRTDQNLHIDEESQLQTVLKMGVDTFYQDILERKDSACYFIPENVWP